jgi:hypothetical protein
MFQPCEVDNPQDPVTPTIEAHAGDKVRIHVFGASSEQNGMFTVEKHEWPIEPFLPGADMISTVEFSGSEGLDVFLPSAGGKWALAGDYVWSNGRLPYSCQIRINEFYRYQVLYLPINRPVLIVSWVKPESFRLSRSKFLDLGTKVKRGSRKASPLFF